MAVPGPPADSFNVSFGIACEIPHQGARGSVDFDDIAQSETGDRITVIRGIVVDGVAMAPFKPLPEKS